MATEKSDSRPINVGILLEDKPKDREWMLTTLAHDSSLDFVVEPNSVEQMFEFLLHLAKEGRRIKKLVLLGHGSKGYRKIGRLSPEDVDIDLLRDRVRKSSEYILEEEANVRTLTEQLKAAHDPAQRLALTQELEKAQSEMDERKFGRDLELKRLQMLEGVSEVMEADAVIGLFNCYAATGRPGRAMMHNLGKVFLRTRGGRVIGCDGLIWVIHSKPLIAWLVGNDDITALTFGTWVAETVSPTRCGAPCARFERYGYCDNPQGKDGGRCWRHRAINPPPPPAPIPAP